MRKLLFILFVLLSASAIAQDSTRYTPMDNWYKFSRIIRVDSAFIMTGFTDTSAANLYKTQGHYLKNIPGAMIRTGNDFWMRSYDKDAWLQFVNIGSGSSGFKNVWSTDLNASVDDPTTAKLGTADNQPLNIYTDSVLRFSVPSDGLKDSGYQWVLTYDTASKKLGIGWAKDTILTDESMYIDTVSTHTFQIGVLHGDSVLYNATRVGDSIRYSLIGGGYIAVYAPIGTPGWSLTGNAGTTPGTNFLGTTDDQDLVFKRNNVQTGRLGVNYTVLGDGADGEATGATAIGSGSIAGTTCTAVGDLASAPFLFSVSVGNGSSSYINGVAIGYQATDNGGGVAIGANSISNNVGISIGANSSGGQYSIALGDNAAAADKQFAISDSINAIKSPGLGKGIVGYVLTDTTGNGDLSLQPSGGGATPNLNAVTSIDSVSTHSIHITGAGKFFYAANGSTFAESGLSSDGYVWFANPAGYYAQLNANRLTAARNYEFQNKSYTVADSVDVSNRLVSRNYIYKLLGSQIKYNPVDGWLSDIPTGSAMVSKRVYYTMCYIPSTTTLTGVKWKQITQGAYTASDYNGVGLYAVNLTNGNLTLVASSTSDGDMWKATSLTIGNKAFSSTYTANEGVYLVAAVWASSATTTAPSIGILAGTAYMNQVNDFANSAITSGFLSSQSSLNSSLNFSGLTPNPTEFWFGLY